MGSQLGLCLLGSSTGCCRVRRLALDPKAFFLLNLALAFYNAGTIWADEIDIFPIVGAARSEEFPSRATGPLAQNFPIGSLRPWASRCSAVSSSSGILPGTHRLGHWRSSSAPDALDR